MFIRYASQSWSGLGGSYDVEKFHPVFKSQFKSCLEKKVSNVFVITDNRTSRKLQLELLLKIIKEPRVNMLNSVDYKWKLTPKESRYRNYKTEKVWLESQAIVKFYFRCPLVSLFKQSP